MSTADVSRLLIADQVLAAALPVGHVEVRRIAMPPGVAAGPHEHNGPVFGVVLTGSVAFQVGDGETLELRAGEPFFEPGSTRITRFDALEDGVEFLAWFPLPAGEAGLLTPLP